MRSKKVMAKKPAAKKVMAKKPAAKKVIAKGKVPVQKYQVGGMAAPARTTATTPAARPVPGGMMSRTFMQRGMTPRSTPRVPAQEPSWMQSGMTPEQRAYVQQLQQQRASRPGTPNPGSGGRVPMNPYQFERLLGEDRNKWTRNERGDFFVDSSLSPQEAQQLYTQQLARIDAFKRAGGVDFGMPTRPGIYGVPQPGQMGMPQGNGSGMMSSPTSMPRRGPMNQPAITPPNSRPRPVPMNQPVITPPPRLYIPGVSPPINRPVRTPPPRQEMPQGMDPAMQQYAQMMQQRQGMQGLGAAQGRRTYYPEFQEQGLFHEVSPQEQQRRMQMVGSSPRAIDMPPQERMDPAMQQQSMQGMQRMEYQPPQPLTQEQLQQLQQFGTPLPAAFKRGGEAKKKAAAQGRMAKPAGRGRTTKPAVRGRMAKPTRGKK